MVALRWFDKSKINVTEIRVVGGAYPRVFQGFWRSVRAYFSDIESKMASVLYIRQTFKLSGYSPDLTFFGDNLWI